ncbi:hypothetical protein PV05_06722 [Exophiala xenobiotica]|uniref:DNA endonuclease activator Ctp1 C-terminal domain-containing protein n=1 Tax=Exophiala xenobiotica TaxID=348802 RepID=A0A0D2EFY3_9EURO|nr:uncharacterized protein PV05_06722 [Exophiala xenobiotica]KIW54358.1 hypothetical protein PV05_06722 [Exophiala xenobiotica]
MNATPQSLTSTLISALGQSETLIRQLDESTKTIERLKRENEKFKNELNDFRSKQDTVPHVSAPPDQQLKRENELLRKEIDEFRIKQNEAPGLSDQNAHSLEREHEKLKQELEELRRKHEDAPGLSAQFEQLFRRDVEKQAEIDQLKSKLRLLQTKERRWRLQNPGVSSPTISSDEVEVSTTPVNTKRKRPRSKSPEVLKEISGNVPAGVVQASKARPKFKRLSDRGADAIPAVAEDGDDYDETRPGSAAGKGSKGKNGSSPHQRLQALLAAPAATTPMLFPHLDASPASPKTASPAEQPKFQAPTPAMDTAAPKTSSLRKPPFLPSKAARTVPEPEDEEPFRSRPVNRLSLAHFKINPSYTGGLDYAYDDIVRGNARKCLPGCTRPECCGGKFRVLADTLPTDEDVSDDDLLRDFLGPGSEEKIRTLTPLARANLVHEARAKRLANLYGKMHRETFERAQSPPGFWNTEFPSTQEDKDNREQARLREREEVEKRCQEAKRGNGRWLFADE